MNAMHKSVLIITATLVVATDANAGRWLSRDPIQEGAGFVQRDPRPQLDFAPRQRNEPNLYAFVLNDPVNQIDFLGLFVELWYGNHVVVGSAHHSKLWVITDEADLMKQTRYRFLRALSKTEIAPNGFVGPCGLYALTIGAGPDQSPDELFAAFNRPKDVSQKLLHPSLVATFSSPSDALQFLARVDARNRVMNANFINTTLEYELFPGSSYTAWNEWDEFNSNSYISGLLNSFGYTPPAPGATVPGYNKPIPTFVFTTVFSSTADLKKVWKAHFPGF